MISSGSFAFHRHVFLCPLWFSLYAQVSSTMLSCRMATSSMSNKKAFSYLIFWEVWCYLHLFLLLKQKKMLFDSTPMIWLLFVDLIWFFVTPKTLFLLIGLSYQHQHNALYDSRRSTYQHYRVNCQPLRTWLLNESPTMVPMKNCRECSGDLNTQSKDTGVVDYIAGSCTTMVH